MKSISNQELKKLVDAARSGKEADLAALIRATEKDLYRFLLFLVNNEALAQDLVQDTYIKVIEHLGELEDSAKFQSWLFRMAKNLFLDHLRSPRNAAYEDVSALEELEAEPDQLDALRAIQDLMAPLGPEDRFAILLVYLHGYSYAEAAEALNVTEDALRSRLHRARATLSGKSGS